MTRIVNLHDDKVIYTGTFLKALSPAIRVSYIVLPNHLLEKYKERFSFHASRVCLMTQKTLEKFIEDGYGDRHLRKIRTINKKKHNLMKKHIEEKLGSTMRIESDSGVLAILINPTVKFDWDKIEILAKKQKIKLHFAKHRAGGNYQAFMIGFGGFKDEEIEKAVSAFSKIWFECID